MSRKPIGLRQSNFNGDLKMTNDKAQMSNQAQNLNDKTH